MSLFNNKRCPRCNARVPIESSVCSSCRLNFQKFNEATNKEAKKALKFGEKDRVLLRKGCPADVSRVKLTLLAVFLGFLGAHHYYVGRYKMGVFYSIFFVVGLVNAVLTKLIETTLSGNMYEIFTILVLVWGIVIFMWIIDLAKICLNKYKIPVSRN